MLGRCCIFRSSGSRLVSKALRTLVFSIPLSSLPFDHALADWAKLETVDPFGEDFKFIIHANEVTPDAELNYAPESILVSCERRKLDLHVLAPGYASQEVRVRFKFDDLAVVDEYWKMNFSIDGVYPDPVVGTFLSNLLTRNELIIELVGFKGDSGFAIYSGLQLGQEEVRKKVEGCEK